MNNYLIIESEEDVINKVKKVLSDFSDFKCIGCAYDYLDPVNFILKNMPDLIFLNLDTTLGDPFDLVKEVNQYLKKDCEFIAISSSKDKTYEAIKYGFFDYLLNPVSELDIRKAALKFEKKHPIRTNKTICLKSYKDYQYLNTDEVLFLKADNNATDFYMSSGKIISAYKTLKTFETVLPNNFLRIHKSYIVNKNYVNRVNYGTLNCTLKKYLKNIPFSKTYLKNVEFMINTLSRSSVLGIS